jgi:hypothetical protein
MMDNSSTVHPLEQAGPMRPFPLRAAEFVFVDEEPGGGGARVAGATGPDQLDLSARIDALENRLGRLEVALGPGSADPPGNTDSLSIPASLARIADALTPQVPDVVGTPYVAGRLGCTTVWVAEMVRNGEVPKTCLVPGTGHGKPWKFYRRKIDEWLASR